MAQLAAIALAVSTVWVCVIVMAAAAGGQIVDASSGQLLGGIAVYALIVGLIVFVCIRRFGNVKVGHT